MAKNGKQLQLLRNGGYLKADRNNIKEFGMWHNRELGQRNGVEHAEAFHYLGFGRAGAGTDPTVDAYVKEHAVSLK